MIKRLSASAILFDRHGRVSARFAPRTKPGSEEIVKAIEALLEHD